MIPILNRYIYIEIIKYIAIVFMAVIGIYLAVDFFERIDNFMQTDLPISKVIAYFFYKIPLMISQLLPVALLLGILVAFGLMSKNNELLAIKSSGIRMNYFIKPIIVIGLTTTLMMFIFSEIIVPICMSRANQIWMGKVKKRALVSIKKDNIWWHDKQFIGYINHYDATNQKIFGITLYYFNARFNLIKRIDAQTGKFKNGIWTLNNVIIQKARVKGVDLDIEKQKKD